MIFLWLAAAIAAYFLFALGNLGDKFVLAGPPKPQSYTFWVATGGAFALFLIPFVGFSFPGYGQAALALFAGIAYIYGLYFLYSALEACEISRAMPALGGFIAIFTLLFSSLFFDSREIFSIRNIAAFFLLLFGSLAAVWEKGKSPAKENLKIIVLAGALFALSYNLSKMVFQSQDFWQGFIWMRIGSFLGASVFFAKAAVSEAFSSKPSFNRSNIGIFVLTQVAGGVGFIFESLSISLAPAAQLSFIAALQGVQYIFLFFFTILLSLKFDFFKEKFSKFAILQKISALVLIVSGICLAFI
jgi:drug/metabolite transporter (DMT)-like permease